jgi:hypothetical protein
MKGIPERAINKSRDGDLRLHPTAWDRFINYGFCILFGFMGAGLFIRGVSLVREGGEGSFGGVFLLFFSLLIAGGSLGIAIFQLRRIGPIHIMREKGVIDFCVVEEAQSRRPESTKLSGHRLVPFEAVASVVVRAESESPYAVSSVRLALEAPKGIEIILNKGMPLWKAKHLAEHTSGILACKARVISPFEIELTPVESHVPWKAKTPPPSPVLGALQVCGFFFMVIGFLSFTGSFIIASWGGNMFMETELPLGNPTGIAMDSTGRVYVGSHSYRRVQRYSADGQFERAWHVPVGKGEWRMSIDGAERLRLVVGNRSFYHIDDNGRLVKVKKLASSRSNSHLRQRTHRVRRGRYYLHRFPVRVICREPGGPERTVVSQGFFMTLITAPFPAWIIFAVGLVTGLAADAAKGSRKNKFTF